MLFTNREFEQANFCPFYPWISCMKPIDFASTYEMKSNLTTKLEVECQNEIDCGDFLNLNETFLFYFSLCMWLVIDGLIHALLVVENDELNHMLGFRILSKLIHDYTP